MQQDSVSISSLRVTKSCISFIDFSKVMFPKFNSSMYESNLFASLHLFILFNLEEMTFVSETSDHRSVDIYRFPNDITK